MDEGVKAKICEQKGHKMFVAVTGQTLDTVWIVTVCTICGEAQMLKFPMDPSDTNQVPVFFEPETGQLVIQNKIKER